jgi:hypothetical protein
LKSGLAGCCRAIAGQVCYSITPEPLEYSKFFPQPEPFCLLLGLSKVGRNGMEKTYGNIRSYNFIPQVSVFWKLKNATSDWRNFMI